MTWIVADRVKETTTTTGTGALTLAGAVSGFRAFSAVCADGDVVFYAVVGGTEWEVGYGSWGTGGILTRVQVLASSNAGALVNFSAGTKEVWINFPALQGSLHGDVIVPPNASVVIADEYEIASGKQLDISDGSCVAIL